MVQICERMHQPSIKGDSPSRTLLDDSIQGAGGDHDDEDQDDDD